MKTLDMKTVENVSNISMMAGYLLERKMIEINDSYELFSTIVEWAEQFEQHYHSDNHDNYIPNIDTFAQKELLKRYGVEELICLGFHHHIHSSIQGEFFVLNDTLIEKTKKGIQVSDELKHQIEILLQKEGYHWKQVASYDDHILCIEVVPLF